MKSHLQRVSVVALGWGLLCLPLMAGSTAPHMTARVSIGGGSDYKDIAGSSERTKRQTRQLTVVLDNREKEPVKDVSIKWTIYAHKMEDNKVVVAKQGIENATVDALKTATIECDKVVITGTPKHTVTTRKTIRGKVSLDSKRVSAKGEDYYGYAVKVYVGNTLVDEAYSNAALKHDAESPPSKSRS